MIAPSKVLSRKGRRCASARTKFRSFFSLAFAIMESDTSIPTTLNPESLKYVANRPVPVPISRIVLQPANSFSSCSRASPLSQEECRPISWRRRCQLPDRKILPIILLRKGEIAMSEIHTLRDKDLMMRPPLNLLGCCGQLGAYVSQPLPLREEE